MQPHILVLAAIFQELCIKNNLVESRAKVQHLYGVGSHSYQPQRLIPEELRTEVGSFWQNRLAATNLLLGSHVMLEPINPQHLN